MISKSQKKVVAERKFHLWVNLLMKDWKTGIFHHFSGRGPNMNGQTFPKFLLLAIKICNYQFRSRSIASLDIFRKHFLDLRFETFNKNVSKSFSDTLMMIQNVSNLRCVKCVETLPENKASWKTFQQKNSTTSTNKYFSKVCWKNFDSFREIAKQ